MIGRAARVATVVLLALGGVAAVALAIGVLAARGSTGRHELGAIRLGLSWIDRRGIVPQTIAGLALAAAVAGLLAVSAWRGRTWALVASVTIAPVGIAIAWTVRQLAWGAEDPRFRRHSGYVSATTTLAIALTILLGATAIAATVALVAERRARPAESR